jgi:hypothetical protein
VSLPWRHQHPCYEEVDLLSAVKDLERFTGHRACRYLVSSSAQGIRGFLPVSLLRFYQEYAGPWGDCVVLLSPYPYVTIGFEGKANKSGFC